MKKDVKERIKQLKKEEKYDEIFAEFGSKIYSRSVPLKYRLEELSKFRKEGRYEDIYRKYGKADYYNNLSRAMYEEIKFEKGPLKANLWKLRRGLKFTGAYLLLMFTALTSTVSYYVEKSIEENAIKYEKDIESYNKKIGKYAKEVQAMNLSDMQIYMKVMDDMWEHIQGYGTPSKNIMGFLELDLATEEGYGVCRNMASDVAKKLNAINPKYNARTMSVTMGDNGEYEIADIKTKHFEGDEIVQENNQEDVGNNEVWNKISKITGNHMITLVDAPNENLTLVLDPTNPGIGIYKNGKITMMNSGKKSGINYESKEFTESIIFEGGFDGLTNVSKTYINSFRIPNISIKEIENKYGIEAQNKALAEVRKIASKSDKESFEDSIKVDLANTKKDINQKENINNNYAKMLDEEELEK